MSPTPDLHSSAPLPGSRQLLESYGACLLARWDELLRNRYQALFCFDLDQIHDLRVASRRLRSAVEQLGPFIGAERANRLRRPVRQLTRQLGQLRNLDEALAYFSDTGHAGLEPLLNRLHRQRGHEMEQGSRLLLDFDCMKMERRVRGAAAALVTPDNIASQGFLALFSERNLQLYRPIHELLPLVARPEMIDERHALRIAVKKWRYFTELLQETLGGDRSEQLQLLRRYQTLLGDMNDRQVFCTLLQETPELPEELRQQLQQRINREQRKLLKRFCELLQSRPLTYHFEL